ncbi:MAG: hypothetical protein Q7R49_06380 [Candidatus Daviesbacteria bacterium]|nr:hypothetical protein [Candidatus Daviesbacteria bacterium]
MLKKFIIILLVLALGITAYKYFSKSSVIPGVKDQATISQAKTVTQTDTPELISTKPDPLDEAIILPTQVVQITFNLPIENIGEFKYKLDPLVKYEPKLSNDRKTVIFTPTPAFPVGTTFTLDVSPDTKFDGGKRLKSGFILHFKTISYKGV